MSVVVYWCIVSTIFWLLLALWIVRQSKDVFHIGVLFSILFSFTYPIKLIATEFGFAVLNSAVLDPKWQLLALGLSNLCALMFMLPVILINNDITYERRVTLYHINNNEKWYWLVLFFVCKIIVYGPSNILNIFDHTSLYELNMGRGDVRLGSSISVVLNSVAFIATVLHFRALLRELSVTSHLYKIGLFVMWIIISYILLAITASKYQAMLPITLFLFMWQMDRVRYGVGIKLWNAIIIFVCVILIIGFVGYLRSFGYIEGKGSDNAFLYAFIQLVNAFDAPDNLSFILSRMDDIVLGDKYFQPTLQYLFLVNIPRFLWPDKPEVFGNFYIMLHYIPERYHGHTGEVISPSMAGEMIVSGGVIFMMIWSIYLGALFGVFYRMEKSNQNILATILYYFLALNIFNLLRSGSGIVGQFIVILIISSIFLVFYNLMQKCQFQLEN